MARKKAKSRSVPKKRNDYAKRLDDIELHVMGLHNAISSENISKRLSDIESFLEELDNSHHAKHIRTKAEVDEFKKQTDERISKMEKSMKMLKKSVANAHEGKEAAEKERDMLMEDNKGLLKNVVSKSKLAKDILLKSTKNAIHDNFNSIRRVGREIVAEDFPDPDEIASKDPAEKLDQELDAKLPAKVDAKLVAKSDISKDKKPLTEEIEESREEKLRREYEEYVQKYGRDPTPGLLVMERLIRKVEDKQPKPAEVKEAVIQKKKVKEAQKETQITNAPIDELYETVVKRGRIKVKEAANKFKVPNHTIERWAKVLEDHDLIKMHNPVVGSAELRKK